MVEVWAIPLGLAVGTVLGALGGGGAILTVPAFVYALGATTHEATSSSLIVVGGASLVGLLGYLRAGEVRLRTGLAFGLAGIPTVYVGTVLSRRVDGSVLMGSFAVVMLAAAVMVGRRAAEEAQAAEACPRASVGVEAAKPPMVNSGASPEPLALSTRLGAWAPIVAAGLGAGFLTAFFGVGGGFVIVPVLVLALRVPMRMAVGTSLLVIAMNSAVAVAARGSEIDVDWSTTLPFLLGAVAATALGKKLADTVRPGVLQRGFAVLLVVVALYIAVTSFVIPQ